MKKLLPKKKPAKTTAPVDSGLFLTFVGEFVKITTKLIVTQAFASEEGSVEQTGPLEITGYLLDYDAEFYYLGDSPDNVSKAISRRDVSMVDEVRKLDSLDLLMETEGPKSVN